MRRLLFIAVIFLFHSCEDVIDVDVPTETPRLVVDAVLRVDRDLPFVPVEVKVSETSDFFSNNTPTQLENAIIFYGVPLPNAPEIFEEVFSSSLAESEPGSGIYVPDPNFSSDQRMQTQNVVPGTVFLLQLQHKGRFYSARTEYVPTVPIDMLEQGDQTLFDEDDTEVRVTITDTPDVNNFYVFDFGFGEFQALEDQFFQGQEFEFSYFYDENLQPGQEITVSILGANQEFFNYIDLLVEQTEDTGGVFEPPVTTARGNVFDVTDLDNIDVFDNVEQPDVFALGYFAVVQEFRSSITIE